MIGPSFVILAVFVLYPLGRAVWLGKVDLGGVQLIGDDLALGGQRITDAPEGLLQSAQSAAMERHLAINWLCGGGEVYSETDTST